jgi:hypothetical protein
MYYPCTCITLAAAALQCMYPSIYGTSGYCSGLFTCPVMTKLHSNISSRVLISDERRHTSTTTTTTTTTNAFGSHVKQGERRSHEKSRTVTNASFHDCVRCIGTSAATAAKMPKKYRRTNRNGLAARASSTCSHFPGGLYPPSPEPYSACT